MCLLCKRIEQIKNGESAYLIKEFKHSYFVVGDHQYFKGYCQLIMKEHYEDLTDVDSVSQLEFMGEVFEAARFLKKKYNCVRVNYSCLGNFAPHVHFHLFPRYQEDLASDETKNPWHCINEFEKYKLSNAQALALSDELKKLIK